MDAMSDYVINLSACELLISTKKKTLRICMNVVRQMIKSIMTFVKFVLVQENHHTKLNHQLKHELKAKEMLTKPLFDGKRPTKRQCAVVAVVVVVFILINYYYCDK